MISNIKAIAIGMVVFVLCATSHAQEVSRQQIEGLDEQVQEIKTDVLAIAEELNQLEEKLLYPSNSQVSIFVSLAEGETFRLDSVELQLDGNPAAHHIYTFKELEALQKGGVQRLYTGNVTSGDHDLQVSIRGKSTGGSDILRSERFLMHKHVKPGIVEISLAAQNINFKDR